MTPSSSSGAQRDAGRQRTRACCPGDTARSSLLFEIQRTALLAELDRWGLEVTDQAAGRRSRSSITQQVPQTGGGRQPRSAWPTTWWPTACSSERLAKLDPESRRRPADAVRRGPGAVGPGVPGRGRSAGATTSARAQDALDGGTELEDLPDKVDGAQLVADPRRAAPRGHQLPGAPRRRRGARTADRSAVPSWWPPRPRATSPTSTGWRSPSDWRSGTTRRGGPGPAGRGTAAAGGAAGRRPALWIGLVLQDGVEVNPRVRRRRVDRAPQVPAVDRAAARRPPPRWHRQVPARRPDLERPPAPDRCSPCPAPRGTSTGPAAGVGPAPPVVHVVGPRARRAPTWSPPGTLALIERVPDRYLRTTRHPAAVAVLGRDASFDHLYERADDHGGGLPGHRRGLVRGGRRPRARSSTPCPAHRWWPSTPSSCCWPTSGCAPCATRRCRSWT